MSWAWVSTSERTVTGLVPRRSELRRRVLPQNADDLSRGRRCSTLGVLRHVAVEVEPRGQHPPEHRAEGEGAGRPGGDMGGHVPHRPFAAEALNGPAVRGELLEQPGALL